MGGRIVNINEECLLQYLSGADFSQTFVILAESEHEIFDCSEYNDEVLAFI